MKKYRLLKEAREQALAVLPAYRSRVFARQAIQPDIRQSGRSDGGDPALLSVTRVSLELLAWRQSPVGLILLNV